MHPYSISIDMFCELENISRSTYYKLKRQGRAPREMKLGQRVTISEVAHEDWRREREAERAAAELV